MTRQERIAELERENEDLRRRNDERVRESTALREELEKLRKRNKRLRMQLDAWKRGLCERRRRRTSRPEGSRRGPRKRPGRKVGHAGAQRPVPDHVDGEIHLDVPTQCACGGDVEPTEEVRSTIVQDLPAVKVESVRHVAHVGVCAKCKKKVAAPLPGDVAAGQSVAKVQVGPNLQAMAVGLRFEQKVTLGNIGAFMGQWFGVTITPGGIAHMLTRLRERSAESYAEIVRHVRGAPVVGADETGLRQNGKSGWCWLVRTARASLFYVDRSRGGHVFDAMLGEGYIGVVVSDFYGVYTSRTNLLHGYCGAHVIREAKKIAELQPCVETAEFRDRIRTFYKMGELAQKSGNRSARIGARIRLGHLISSTDYVAFPDIIRLQERLELHKAGVTLFLDNPAVPWHNNHTETDVRAIARYRAATGGIRSENGSKNVGHWMSITQTRRKNALPLRSFVAGVYDAHLHKLSPPSVFAP